MVLKYPILLSFIVIGSLEDVSRDTAGYTLTEANLDNAIKNLQLSKHYDSAISDHVSVLLTMCEMIGAWMTDEISALPFQQDNRKEKMYGVCKIRATFQ